MSGSMQRSISGETESVPRWDVHLSGVYENRNFLGGFRRLRIEDRPRLIMLREFPGITNPRFGNVLSVNFIQPAALERHTSLFSENTWDIGPDSYQGFFRHDLGNKLGLQRHFWRRRLYTRFAIAHDLYEITDADRPATVSDYRLPYFEQYLVFDLRNDPQRPRLGGYFSVTAQQALQLGGYGSWDYLRVAPDLRGYLPLMWDFVLAARFALGALFVMDADSALDSTSKKLGPQSYRLRGGGANSNRGFGAGKLGVGAGLEGGIRRFEGSLELRIPFGSDFGMALFGDVGDVNQGKAFRFDYLNAAVGFGLRYYTILGPIRFDAGWRVPGLQRLGSAPEPRVRVKVPPSAAHLTIGQAF
jgi:translocation and assembly module TamA